MAITIETGSNTLTFLLFVRTAWRIKGTDIPTVDPVPSVGESRRPDGLDPEALLNEWNRAWSQAVADLRHDRVPHPVDPATQARLDVMSVDQLLALNDPRQSATFGDGVDLQALAEWDWAGESRPNRLPLEEQPEQVNLAELVPAWRGGLRTITELPFAEDWAHRTSSSHLLVAACTRSNKTEYGRALTLPVEPPR